MTSFARRPICFLSLLLLLAASAPAQSSAERVFPEPKATIENALKNMQANLSGRLPTLDGFATPASHTIDQYERGYFQVSVGIAPLPSGASLVHVSAKITAWYSDPAKSHSGYQLLKSNGRIEADLLDQLADQLASNSHPDAAQPATQATESTPAVPASPPQQQIASTTSDAKPGNDDLVSAPSAKLPQPGSFSSSLSSGLAEEAKASAPTKGPGQTDSQLQAEAQGLEEILKNQAHPKNLVAVRKSGTPVVDKPSLTAKTLFVADLHDEFEMLDFNEDWVHVRISGLSRGWIWRGSLEMPAGIPDAATHPSAAVASADLFHVTREESAQFPGDWPALRGKSVKILTIQKVDDNAKTGGPQDKLEFSKYLLDKTFSEVNTQKQDFAGIVLIFDSADGGMIASTMATLQQWKTGNLSDAALWHNCFFDPPETFAASASAGSQ